MFRLKHIKKITVQRSQIIVLRGYLRCIVLILRLHLIKYLDLTDIKSLSGFF